MTIQVEPLAGSDLDRLITALLNVTGVVHQTMEATDAPADADGVAFIGLVAQRLRRPLSLLAEMHSDAELGLATQVLAQATLLAAADLGMDPETFT